MKTTIHTDAFEGWKARAKATAKAMDRGERIAPSRSITLESPETMLRLLTPGRMRVLNTVRQHPTTVSALAKRLKRDVLRYLAMWQPWSGSVCFGVVCRRTPVTVKSRLSVRAQDQST
jgi:predicted transcriptional regulator